MSAGLKSARDVSLVSKHPGPGQFISQNVQYMCGHTGPRLGGTYRSVPGLQRLWMKCAACNTAHKAARLAAGGGV